MTSTTTPVSGGGADQGKPDGVSDSPGDDTGSGVHGRSASGESGGGAYPNPQSGRAPDNGGFMGHGGQTDMDYHGGGQGGTGDAPNAVTGSDSSDGEERGAANAWEAPRYEPHAVTTAGRTFAVIETNGIAEAEAAGKVGTDAPYEREQEQPGSG